MKRLKRLSFLVSVVLIMPLVCPVHAHAARTIAIDPTIQYQTLEGWGTSLAWWGHACGNWTNTAMRDQLLDDVFGEDGLALNVVRYNIGGGENPDHDHMRIGGEVPGYQITPGVYDWTADPGQRYVLQGAIDRGADITEAFLNSPPYWMTYSQCTSGSTNGLSNNLYDDHYDEFADYMTEVIKHFRDDWGVTFDTVSPFNEPSTPLAWTAGGSQEGCHYDLDKQNQLITELGNSLAAKGLTTEISGPEETILDWNITTYGSYDSTAKDYLKQLNVHTYHGTQRAQTKCLAFQENKRLWMSEVGFGGSDVHDHDDIQLSLELANGIIMDMKYIQPSAWVCWQVVEHETYEGNWGMIHADFTGANDYSLTKAYYAFGQFTKFIQPGYKFIGSNIGGESDNNTLAAYDEDSHTAVFVIKHNATDPGDYVFDLSKFASVGTVNAYRTSPTQNMAQLADIQPVNGHIDTTLPGESITTYVVNDAYLTNNRVINDIEVGTGQNEMNFVGDWNFNFDDGCWDFDNHHSWTTDAYVIIPFYGTGFDIIASKDNCFGKFAISVDDGPETIVDCYSLFRSNNQTLYQQSGLARGQHTIKIRVTGTKNSWSSAATINVDRVDVFDQ